MTSDVDTMVLTGLNILLLAGALGFAVMALIEFVAWHFQSDETPDEELPAPVPVTRPVAPRRAWWSIRTWSIFR